MKFLHSKFQLLVLCLVVSACASSSGVEPNRVIAEDVSASTLAQNEKIFQDMWGSVTPAGDFMKQVDRMVSLYLRAQKFLMDFDSELGGDLNALNRSEPYRKLQVIRELQEEQVEKVVFLYGRLIDMQQSGEPASAKKASAVLSGFGRYMLLNRNKLNRLAMQNVVGELRAVRAERQQKAAELEGIEFKNPEEIKAFLDEKEGSLGRREALAQAAIKEAAVVDQEFDDAFVESEKAETKVAREPQSGITHFPSAGRAGNLMGYELPMGTYAITFDDGPSHEWTPKILQTLGETGFQTTFFWLAKNLASHKMDGIVARAKREGHTLANHSYSHADLSKPNADLNLEVVRSTAVEKEIYGSKPSYFRCPYGSCVFKNTVRTREAIASQRMLHVTWTIDSLDWQDKDPASVYERVLKQIKKNGRGIILFHDIHPQSYAASTMLLKNYFARNRNEVRLLTISQIVRELNSLPPAKVQERRLPKANTGEPAMPDIFNWLPWGRSE